MQNSPYNSIGWMTIVADTTLNAATWHKPFEVKDKSFSERDKARHESDYYRPLKSAAVKANYNGNVFTLQTSGITEATLKISPRMVDLSKPVIVIANGKQVFKGFVKADKAYLLSNFGENADREALWVNSIKVKIE